MGISRMYDAAVERKEIFPLYVFTDPFKGIYNGGNKFMCFVGTGVPQDIFLAEEKYRACIERLRSGAWKLQKLEEFKEKGITDKMFGYGFGITPAKAFMAACQMSGHIKPNVVVQGT